MFLLPPDFPFKGPAQRPDSLPLFGWLIFPLVHPEPLLLGVCRADPKQRERLWKPRVRERQATVTSASDSSHVAPEPWSVTPGMKQD